MSARETSTQPMVPTMIADRYELGSLLGRGAMGAVYAAEDSHGHRLVAVKLLVDNPECAGLDSLEAARRLRDEAQAAVRVTHPSLVAVLDSGEDQKRGPFIVFEYLAGGSLAQELDERTRLPWAEVIERVARPLFTVLAVLHEQQILHRDIKPDNMLQGDDGCYKVGDLGLAAFEGRQAKTKTGLIVGTIGYLAPERLRNADLAPTAKGDLYAAAMVVVRAATGRLPFTAQAGASLLQAQMTETVAASTLTGTGIPAHAAKLLANCLERNPAHRPETARQVLTALETEPPQRTIDGQQTRLSVQPTPPTPKAPERNGHQDANRRNPRTILVMFSLIALLVLLFATSQRWLDTPRTDARTGTPSKEHRLLPTTKTVLTRTAPTKGTIPIEELVAALSNEIVTLAGADEATRSIETGRWLRLLAALQSSTLAKDLAEALREERFGTPARALRLWSTVRDACWCSPLAELFCTNYMVRLAIETKTDSVLAIIDQSLWLRLRAGKGGEKRQEQLAAVTALLFERVRQLLVAGQSTALDDLCAVLARYAPALQAVCRDSPEARAARDSFVGTVANHNAAKQAVSDLLQQLSVATGDQSASDLAATNHAQARQHFRDLLQVFGTAGRFNLNALNKLQTDFEGARRALTRMFWINMLAFVWAEVDDCRFREELLETALSVLYARTGSAVRQSQREAPTWDRALSWSKALEVCRHCLDFSVSEAPPLAIDACLLKISAPLFTTIEDLPGAYGKQLLTITKGAVPQFPDSSVAKRSFSAYATAAAGDVDRARTLFRQANERAYSLLPLDQIRLEPAAARRDQWNILSESSRLWWRFLCDHGLLTELSEATARALKHLEQAYPTNRLTFSIRKFHWRSAISHGLSLSKRGKTLPAPIVAVLDEIIEANNERELILAAKSLKEGRSPGFTW